MSQIRQGNRWDAVINSVNYRLRRDTEKPYRKFTARSLLELQQLLQQGRDRQQFTSRSDVRPLFQTSWAAGEQWNKPLLSEQTIESYYVSKGFDLVREPGNIIPQPNFTNHTVTSPETIDNRPRPIQVAHDELYYAHLTDGTSSGLMKWDGSSFTKLTNQFGTTFPMKAMCWDAANATVFGLWGTAGVGAVAYVTPDSAGGLPGIGSMGDSPGRNIMMHFGRLLIYDGEQLWEGEDPLGSPSKTSIFNDGMGPDVLSSANDASASIVEMDAIRLAVASSEGVWIVKNVNQNGMFVPFIHRVDRTNDGIDVGVPVATLPPNTVALDVFYHMGSLLITATTDINRVFQNDATNYGRPRVVLYHLTNNSLGTIGVLEGGTYPEDSPMKIIGAEDSKVFIGGQDRIYVYDAVRGGIHRWLDNGNYSNSGNWHSVLSTESGTDDIYQMGHTQVLAVTRRTKDDIGGDSQTHTLESNYFDGNLPSELKSCVAVTLMTDGIKANETWTIGIEADDAGSFTTKATYDNDGDKTVKKEFATAVTGYRFRYKITYTASSDVASPSRVKGIVFHMVQGEMVVAWQLVLDGSHMSNVENTKQDPDDVLTNLEALAGTQTIVSYVDEFRKTSSTHDVRVQNVSIDRQNPQEIEQATVVLYEHNLDN